MKLYIQTADSLLSSGSLSSSILDLKEGWEHEGLGHSSFCSKCPKVIPARHCRTESHPFLNKDAWEPGILLGAGYVAINQTDQVSVLEESTCWWSKNSYPNIIMYQWERYRMGKNKTGQRVKGSWVVAILFRLVRGRGFLIQEQLSSDQQSCGGEGEKRAPSTRYSTCKYGKASCWEDNVAAGMGPRLERHPGAHLPTKSFYCGFYIDFYFYIVSAVFIIKTFKAFNWLHSNFGSYRNYNSTEI